MTSTDTNNNAQQPTESEVEAQSADNLPIEDELPEHWDQVAGLRPQLHMHVKAHAHDFRGSRWYILSDSVRGKHLRFNDVAYEFIGRLDGDHTVDEIYKKIQNSRGNECPGRQDVLTILIQLFGVGALRSGLPTDVQQLFEKKQNEISANRTRRLLNPLALRFPLFDPDNFLNKTITSIRPLFSIGSTLIWLMVVGLATLLLMVNYQELLTDLKTDILSPRNIILMLALFPLMKAVHEFAHAYAIKIWGGEVHEMGITLLVLMPVPYVDATASWAFREKYKRILVSAAGMIAELFLAAIALIIWTLVQPGTVQDAALSAFLIGSVSTVLFNANPLLRFDGYYILQDAIEIPNLYTRSSRYILYLVKRYILQLKSAVSPVTDISERPWLGFYGVLAWLYRVFITFVIAIFLAGNYFVLGVALALWSLTLMFILPTYRGLRFLFTDPTLNNTRGMALKRSAAVVALVALPLLVIPFSNYTDAQGVVWVSDQAQIFAETDGFIEELSAAPGDQVNAGETVLTLNDPNLDSRSKVLRAKFKELSSRYKSEKFNDPVQADQTQEEIKTVEADWQELQTQRDAQSLASTVTGTFVPAQEKTMIGRYIKKGEPVGYVIDPEELIVRVVLPQTSVGLFSKNVKSVSVRMAEQPRNGLQATIIRQTPAGSFSLPSRALGAAGGGDIAVDTKDEAGTTAVNKVFQIDLALPEDSITSGLGTRAFVRVNHGREVLAKQWLRGARQLLLSKLPF